MNKPITYKHLSTLVLVALVAFIVYVSLDLLYDKGHGDGYHDAIIMIDQPTKDIDVTFGDQWIPQHYLQYDNGTKTVNDSYGEQTIPSNCTPVIVDAQGHSNYKCTGNMPRRKIIYGAN